MKNIDPDILRILSELEINGNAVKITTQLDRKTYESVNKVLVACGGKWDRKAKAHLFEGDAADLLDTVMTTGQYTSKKNELAFFPTPEELADQLVEMAHFKRGAMVLEPSAGTGRITDAILKAGGFLCFVERDENMRAALVERYSDNPIVGVIPVDDFMLFQPKELTNGGFDAVVMNPPFKRVGLGDHLDHVLHAFELLRPSGTLVAVLPRSVEFRQDKRYRDFRAWLNYLGRQGTRHRLDRLPDDSFKASGTRVCTNVLVIEKDSGRLV